MLLTQGEPIMNEALLSVQNLSVDFKTEQQSVPVVKGISFDIHAGETFALVGESGSGKSISALSVLRLLPPSARMNADSIMFQQQNLLRCTEAALCAIRGRRIAIIFQDPMAALNPVKTIGAQIGEVLDIHYSYTPQYHHQRVLELMQQVEIPEPERRYKEYSHQLSGGQQQRVMIANALAGEPDLLIADEPTTALDVTIQAQILTLLKKIQQQNGMALWLISHDLALVSTLADRVTVMQNGKIVETGSGNKLFSNPQHPYTQQLLAALPSMQSCLDRPQKKQSSLLVVQDFNVHYPIHKGLFKRVVGHVKAVNGVSLTIAKGQTLALVGESGCGKTTLGKALLNLIPSVSGKVSLDGIDVSTLNGEALRLKRSEMQIVFQDPFASMNPRMLVSRIIDEGVRALHPKMTAEQRCQKINLLLQQVNLDPSCAERYPHEFSGGQRQRICIARALAVEPKLIICDEPTSALDVSVQATIIKLLKSLQQEQNISYLFITHDLAVVAEIADQVAVMYQGKIIEQGGVEQVLRQPEHDYTRRLLDALPTKTGLCRIE